MDAASVAGVAAGVAALAIILPALVFTCMRHKEAPTPGVGPSLAHRNWKGTAPLDPLLQPNWAKLEAARVAQQPQQQLNRILSHKGAAASAPQRKGSRPPEESDAWRLAMLRMPSTTEKHGLPSHINKQLGQSRRVVPGLDRKPSRASITADSSTSLKGGGMPQRASSHVSSGSKTSSHGHAHTTGGGGAHRLLAAPEPALTAVVAISDPQLYGADSLDRRPSGARASSINVRASSTANAAEFAAAASFRAAGQHDMDIDSMEEGESSYSPFELRQGTMDTALSGPRRLSSMAHSLGGQGASASPALRRGLSRVVPATGDVEDLGSGPGPARTATSGSGGGGGQHRTPSVGWAEDGAGDASATERISRMLQHNKSSLSRFAHTSN